MSAQTGISTARAPGQTGITAADPVIECVLVVDDSKVQRKILSALLKRWGYRVIEASSGGDALTLCAQHRVDLILSDWMMPGMTGLDFCRAFRALQRDHYGYFILLTSKSEKGEVAEGLDVGADDFLSKPVNSGELRARIAAGARILAMQRELKLKNSLIDRDLIEARKFQQSLIRERVRNFERATVSLLLRPSGHVGGDLVGVFPINKRRIGVFALDVSGHGITSALMTARLAGFLSASSPTQNVALRKCEDGSYTGRPPAKVAARLNDLTLQEMDTENYFTLIYADIDLVNGRVEMVQAGHPSPAIMRADGTVEFVGEGGMPVGLLPSAEFESYEFQLEPGDRMLMYSDGVTECPTGDTEMLEEEGLVGILERNRAIGGTALLEAIVWDLAEQSSEAEFSDDVSAALLEFHGALGLVKGKGD